MCRFTMYLRFNGLYDELCIVFGTHCTVYLFIYITLKLSRGIRKTKDMNITTFHILRFFIKCLESLIKYLSSDPPPLSRGRGVVKSQMVLRQTVNDIIIKELCNYRKTNKQLK